MGDKEKFEELMLVWNSMINLMYSTGDVLDLKDRIAMAEDMIEIIGVNLKKLYGISTDEELELLLKLQPGKGGV